MNEKLRRRLSDFAWQDCLTKININNAIFKTLNEIDELLDCGMIGIDEYVQLAKELWEKL